ncbi:MAG: hypothetical protein ACJASV_002702 [Pseudorhodobacter sp.]
MMIVGAIRSRANFCVSKSGGPPEEVTE